VWITAVLLSLAAGPESVIDSQPIAIAGSASRAESASFVVTSQAARIDARQAARTCECWRSKLQQFWCGGQRDAWSPKCQIVVHASRGSYLGVVGAGGAATYGSSLLDFGKDKQVASRRIDIRGDSPLGMAALPHELTHVVLADLLDGRQPPRWADEGMAILADARDKQLLHERDLTNGLASRVAFRVAELMAIENYPHPSRVPAFYGQSASLTAFLAHRDDPAKFVEFLRRALDQGYDAALRQVYAIENVGELERLWREQRLAWRSGYHGLRLSLHEGVVEERVQGVE
jgi:hypothetical protein